MYRIPHTHPISCVPNTGTHPIASCFSLVVLKFVAYKIKCIKLYTEYRTPTLNRTIYYILR